VQTTRVFVRDSTVVTPYAFLLFGGDISVKHEEAELAVDGWIQFRGVARTGVLFKEVRRVWESLLVNKIENPSRSFREMCGGDLIEVIARLVATEGD
jgi:hypothetical protein